MSRTNVEGLAGMSPQFAWSGDGWLFRRHGTGPAVPVTAQECAAFLRRGLYAILVHVAALVLLGGLAWLVLQRLLPAWSDNAVAGVFGVVLSFIGLALHGSLRHHADAPTRALAGRPAVAPALDPDDRTQPPYGAIGCLAVVLLFLAAIGNRRPESFYVAFASASVIGCAMLAVRRYLFDTSLTPAQRARLRDRSKAESDAWQRRHQDQGRWWQLPLLLGFIVLEFAMLIGGVLLGLGIVLAISGRTSDQLTFGLFMLGFLPGLAAGVLAFLPLERLCKRWTGASAVHAFDWVPVNW